MERGRSGIEGARVTFAIMIKNGMEKIGKNGQNDHMKHAMVHKRFGRPIESRPAEKAGKKLNSVKICVFIAMCKLERQRCLFSLATGCLVPSRHPALNQHTSTACSVQAFHCFKWL